MKYLLNDKHRCIQNVTGFSGNTLREHTKTNFDFHLKVKLLVVLDHTPGRFCVVAFVF